jgi:hypothetical protein
MRRLLLAGLAALLATMPIASAAGAASPTRIAASDAVLAISDPADALPSPEEVKAAFTLFGLPAINHHDLPDNDSLWDLFDEAARFVIPPSNEIGEVNFVVGSYIIDEGTDERQDFADTMNILKAYAQKRAGPGGASDVKPVETADLFGANEANEVYIGKAVDGKKNLMIARLARFGKTIIFVSGDTTSKGAEVLPEESLGLALTQITLAKLVSDKVK